MSILKKALPHIIAVVAFLVVTLVYFSPLLEGKRLGQYDILQSNGSSKEVNDFREKTGKEALWTNSTFGGMPAYQISVAYPNNWTNYLTQIVTFGLPSPAYMIFLALLGFYVTLLCFNVNPWLSIAGAFAYGLSAYFMLILGAGHNTKMRALSFMPLIIGGVYLAFCRKKIWLGMILTCLALGLQLRANHLQITYYTAIIILIFLIFVLVQIIRDKQYNKFIKATAAMIVALVLAVGMNITNMLLTAEYTPYSTRGASELTDESGDQTKGLDRSYILDRYSYSIPETMVLFIPNFVGGPSAGPVSTHSPIYEALVQNGVPQAQATQFCKQVPLYWGGQEGGTSGPMYIGAVIIFLFVLGLFTVKGPLKWWLLIATILSIMLAWGMYFPMLSNLFIDYFPMYNKFRTVSMVLVIAIFTIPLLGILGVNELLGNNLTTIDKQKALKKSFFITGGIALFFVLFPGLLFSFDSPWDAQMNYPDWLIAALHDTREAVLRNDSFRSLLFVVAAAVVLWFTVRGKLKVKPACALLAALILVDLWVVDKRYLDNDRFIKAKSANVAQPTPADLAILEDKDPDYRVLNLTVSTFNDATTSYFHKSLGGYHGAKMKRYQELIEHRLSPEISTIYTNMQAIKTEDDVKKLFRNCPAINMLNTRYVIYNKDQRPISNPDALGNAWIVPGIRWVDNADAEMAALSNFNPAKEAIVDKRFQPELEGFTVHFDSSASISLASYEPNHLVYEYHSQQPQMVVFSEIFYDKGWNAYVDGTLTPHVRADYVLRAMVVPAGKHEVVFKFEPKSYARGEKIALASSIATVLLILGVIGKYIYDNKYMFKKQS